MSDLLTRDTLRADAPVIGDPAFRSILCGVDGTRGAEEAARQAAVVAGAWASVCYLAVTYDADLGATVPAALRHADGEAAAGDARRRAHEAGVQAGAFTLHAAPATDALLRRAADHDLLVLGAGAGGTALGRTATAAVHRCPVPLLLARRAPGGARFPRTILVSAAGGPLAGEVLRLGAAIAAQHDARLTVVEQLATLGTAAAANDASLVVVGGGDPTGVAERVAREAGCSVLVVREP